MDFSIIEMTDTFVYGRLGLADTNKIMSAAKKTIAEEELMKGEVGDEGDETIDDEVRKTSVYWMTKSKKVRRKIDEFVSEFNDLKFKQQMDEGGQDYQVTIYDNPNDHYDWHQDYYDDDVDDFVRTVSLSICLSPDTDYLGAEFFIKDGSESNVRVFKMDYGDFIIFPSEVEHKVNALRDGARTSLVVWYGHELE